MKILHLEASCGWGGQDIRVLTVCRELHKRGYDVALICQPQSELARRAKEERFETYDVPMSSPYDLQALAQILRIIKRERIEILHTHSSIDSWLGAFARRFCPQTKLVRTRHVSTRIRNNIQTRWLYTQADLILTTSASIASSLKTQFPSLSRLISLPTGIDMDRFDHSKAKRGIFRSEIGVGSREILIGTVGVLRSWKGHDLFLQLASKLGKRRERLRFLLVGDGPARERLQTLASSLELNEKVLFLGHREDIANVLAGLDIFLFPSYASEGVPQAILQALAMGKPIVATRIGGIPEIVRSGETGLLVLPNDVDALVKALLLILDNPTMASYFSKNGRMSVQKFSLESMIDQIEELYRALIR